jgi:antitoxin CcdA
MKPGYNLEARRRPVNLTLNEDLVQQAKGMTNNLSGVVESLLSDFVAQEQKHRLAKAKTLKATIAVWNDFNSKMGTFSDEYSSLQWPSSMCTGIPEGTGMPSPSSWSCSPDLQDTRNPGGLASARE